MAASKRRSHGIQATKVGERRSIAECALLRLTERVGDGVSSDAGDGGLRVLKDLSVLDVEALDLAHARAGADELRDDSHLGLGVESCARSVEVLNAHAVAVEVAAVLVANALVAIGAVAAVDAGAGYETSALAGVGRVGGGNRVSLPNVHLGAAGAEFARAGVGVVGGRDPAVVVGLAVDPLDVVGALGVAVSCGESVCGCKSNGLNLPVPYLAPALLLPLFRPPSAAISTKYRAPFRPQGRLETSTSKVNSLLMRLNIWYLVSVSMR
jgi:hypothetical protein